MPDFIIFAFQYTKNFMKLDVIFGILFIFVPPKQATRSSPPLESEMDNLVRIVIINTYNIARHLGLEHFFNVRSNLHFPTTPSRT